ncbi:MAG: hypothetical protein L0154_04910 [Chloroflexi bacterium]|nr:hypothetical protein [Chloroflexota bacterium]
MGQNPFDNQQNNNPWGQQQGSGGSGQQQNPFGQQQGGFSGQQFGGPSGFNQPIEPQKRGGGAGRACLIVFGLIFACIVICCGAVAFLGVTNKPAVPAVVWLGLAGTGTADETAGVVCEGSPAEVYSLQFVDRYPNVTAINFTDFQINDDTVTLNGDVTYDEGTESLNLEFIIDPEGESDLNFGLVDFGCIQDINDLDAE